MSRVALSKDILEWALKRRGLSADAMSEKFPKIKEWLAGSSQPTLKQIEALARATSVPLGFFFEKTA